MSVRSFFERPFKVMNSGVFVSQFFLSSLIPEIFKLLFCDLSPGGGGGGYSHMKETGMLVVSLRGVNFGFWSRLGCSGQSANILSCQGLV